MRTKVTSKKVGRVETLGPGRYSVQSGTDPDTWYGVIDGQCSCKGFSFNQKCKHVNALIGMGLLSPDQVEAYTRNQSYPPVKLADPDEDYRYPLWTASYYSPYLRQHYKGFMAVGLTAKPRGVLLAYPLEAYLDPIMPDPVMLDMLQNGENELFVDAYRRMLNRLGVDHVAALLAAAKKDAGPRNVVLLTDLLDVTGRDGFADPRRVLSTWWYERTRQVIPEIRRTL